MEKNIEVLISTMNLRNLEEIIDKMNIRGKSLIINQITHPNSQYINIVDGSNRVLSYNEKGLSRSRNRAIENCNGEICIIADDDLTYVDDYENIISKSYEKFKDADIIAFTVKNQMNKNVSKINRQKIGFLHSMQLCSVQLTFKKNSLLNSNIKFDEKFGTGSEKYIMGEENIFLFDCLNKKLKIYYVDETIAFLNESESTWFKGYTKDYFISKGACFYRMSSKYSMVLILQFAIRKYNLYKNNISLKEALRYMIKGFKEMKNIK